MSRGDETLVERVRAALDAQRAFKQAMSNAYSPDWIHLDLSMAQLKAMMGLATLGDMSVSELADWMKTSKPSASVLVDRLVHQDYAARREDPADRRRTLVTLTEHGTELIAGLERSGGERMGAWLARMRPDDLIALTRGLRALTDIVTDEVARGGGNEQTSEAVKPALSGRDVD